MKRTRSGDEPSVIARHATGHRDGEADQHWLVAEQEILSSLRSVAVAKAPAKRIRGRVTVKRSGGRPD
jgi:hypothetical protein